MGNFIGKRVYLTDFNDNIGNYHEKLQAHLKSLQRTETPVAVWVNPENPGEAIIDRQIRWGLLLMIIGFCSAFIVVGLAVCLASIFARDEKKVKKPATADQTGELWRQKPFFGSAPFFDEALDRLAEAQSRRQLVEPEPFRIGVYGDGTDGQHIYGFGNRGIANTGGQVGNGFRLVQFVQEKHSLLPGEPGFSGSFKNRLFFRRIETAVGMGGGYHDLDHANSQFFRAGRSRFGGRSWRRSGNCSRHLRHLRQRWRRCRCRARPIGWGRSLTVGLRCGPTGCRLILFVLENFEGAYPEADDGHQPGAGGQAAEQGALAFLMRFSCSDHFT